MALLLNAEHLTKHFGGNTALGDVSVQMNKGELVCVIGPSGCGKSTLLRSIGMVTPPDAGDVYIDGKWYGGGRQRPRRRRDPALRGRVGFVFQNFNLWPHLTVVDNLMKAQVVVLKRTPQEARARALELLARFGLEGKRDAYPDELSGGQQQRVAIARALVMDPLLMLCDEPTASLDPERVTEVLAVLRALALADMTMLIVTHELRFAAQLADRIVFMDGGIIIEQGPPAELFNQPRSERLRAFLAQLKRA